MSIEWEESEILSDEVALGQVLECVEKGVFCALLGPPRSGKTFTLRLAQDVIRSDEEFLEVYIDLHRHEFFRAEIAPHRALDNFFFQLTRDIVFRVDTSVSEPASEREAGGAGFVRAIGTFARSEQRRIVLFLDHFEVLPAIWGHALLGALRAVYDQRLPSSPYFKRVTVVISSSVDIFEASLGKTSPLSIARMVTTNDLARQQVERFLQTALGEHHLTISKQDMEDFYEATLGNRILTITLCRQWIEESSDQEAVRPFEELAEHFLSRIHQDHRVGLMISQIEENTDVLTQVLDLMRGVPVKRRAFRTGLSDLELTGAVRSSENGFAIHNPLFKAILEHHFTPERVIYLLDKADQPLTVLKYLHNLLENRSLETYSELYLKVISDVVAWARNDLLADDYLLEGMSRVFGVTEAHMCHVSKQQVLVRPAHQELSDYDHSLVQYALAQRQSIPTDTDPITVAIPINTQTDAFRDVLLLPNFCERDYFVRERGRLTAIRRFCKEAMENRVRQARAEKFRYLQESTASISSCLEEEILLQEIVQSACEILSADFATIYLYDSSKGQFERGFAYGLHNPRAVRRPPRRRGVSFGMLESGLALTVTTSQLEGTTKHFGRTLSPRTMKSLKEEEAKVSRGYPILLGDNRIGVLFVGYRSWHFFRSLEDEAINALLSQSAVIISRSYLLQAIRRITRAIGREESKSPEGQIRILLQSTTGEVCRLLGVPRAYAWRTKQVEGQRYKLYDGVTNSQGEHGPFPSFLVDSLPGVSWGMDEPVVLSTTESSPAMHDVLQQIDLGGSLSAIIGFAHSPRQRVSVFIVGVNPRQQRSFTKWDISMFRALITQVASQAENAHLSAKDKERLQRLEAIFTISEQCGRLDVESDLLKQVIKFAVRTIPGADAGSIHLLDATKQWLEIAAYAGYDEDDIERLQSIRLQFGQGYAGQAVRDQLNLNIRDFDREMDRDELSNPLGVQSALIIPMIVRNKVFGTINVDSRSTTAAFGESDEKWLETLANQIAIAIDRMRLIERLETELYVIGETIGLSPDNISVPGMVSESLMRLPGDIFQSILEKAVSLTNAEMGNIWLYDSKGNVLVNYAHFPKDVSVDKERAQMDLTNGIIGKVVTQGKSILAKNTRELESLGFVSHFQEDIQAELAIPLKVGTQMIGVINLESPRENAFDLRDKEALERLAAAMSSSIVRMALHKRASELAEQNILQKSHHAMLNLEFDADLRVACELRPSSLGVRRSTSPITFGTLGFADPDDLRHELERLCDYIQMAYRLRERQLRSEWLRWAKRIGTGFMQVLQRDNRSIADAILGIELMGMRPEEILIRVTTSREHIFLPFELLYLEDWPCVILYPLVRTVAGTKSFGQETFENFVNRKIERQSPIKILLIGADVQEGMMAEEEIKSICEELLRVKKSMGIPLEIKCYAEKEMEIERVKSILKKQDYHILHIAGEGYIDPERPDNSGIVLSSVPGEKYEILRIRELAPLLAIAQPRFVYLSLCRGAQVSEGRALRSGSTLGILDALVQMGVPAVLGYRWDVTAQGAKHFAQCFYSQLFAEKSLELATFYARREIYNHQDLNETWISPILVNQRVDESFWTGQRDLD